jgi:hypothetical protein
MGAIHNRGKRIASFLALLAVVGLISACATKETRLVNDPDEKPESAVPWNKQEKWETAGAQLGVSNPTDRR